jgi:hypothetical protein
VLPDDELLPEFELPFELEFEPLLVLFPVPLWLDELFEVWLCVVVPVMTVVEWPPSGSVVVDVDVYVTTWPELVVEFEPVLVKSWVGFDVPQAVTTAMPKLASEATRKRDPSDRRGADPRRKREFRGRMPKTSEGRCGARRGRPRAHRCVACVYRTPCMPTPRN